MKLWNAFAPEVIMHHRNAEAIAVHPLMEAIAMKPHAVEAVESVMKTDATVEVKRTVERRTV